MALTTFSGFSPATQTTTQSSGTNLSVIPTSSQGLTLTSVTFQISTDKTFATGVTTLTASNVVSGATATVSTGTLTAGQVYYWRVMATDSNSTASAYSRIFVLYISGTSTQNISPDAIVSETNTTGTVSTINDNPSSPDTTFMTPTTSGTSMVVTASFPTPTNTPLVDGSGLQTFNVYAKRTNTNGTVTMTINILENGTTIATSSAITVSSTTGAISSFTWDATSLTDQTGAGVQIQVTTTAYHSGSKYTDIDIGAVQWVADCQVSPATVSDPNPSDTTPPANVTNLTANSSYTTVALNWSNPSDSDYSYTRIYRNSTLIGTSLTGAYNDSGLATSTAYIYKVTSVDQAGNESSGTTVSATTLAQTTAPSVPANLFPFPNSAWTKVHFEADITDVDSTNLTFYVDYSETDSTLATHTTVSTPVTLPSVGSTVRASMTPSDANTENTVVYWRAYVKDDSGATSAYTSIFSYTIKNASGDNMVPDGTQFMQQGDPNYHGIIVDINSANDTSINFTTMIGQGVKGCYLRCYGHDHTAVDANFNTWASQANTAGMPTGAYFYAMPASPTLNLTDAHTQADLFISALQSAYGTGKYGDLLPMLDLEDNSSYVTAGQATTNMTVSDLLTWANEFRNYFEAQTGRILGLYVDNYFVFNTMGNFNYDSVNKTAVAGTSGNIVHDMPLWVAGDDSYPRYMGQVMPECGGWLHWYAFQHTSKATASTYGVTTTSNNLLDISWCEPIEWLEPPKTPTGLAGTDDGTNIYLLWNATTEKDVHDWDIYVDGNKVGSTSSNGSYTITSATPNVSHTIEVRPIDDFGDKPVTPSTISYTLSQNPPNVEIVSISKSRISAMAGSDTSVITFYFDKKTKSYKVMTNGNSYDSGTLCISANAGETISQVSGNTVLQLSGSTVSSLSSLISGSQVSITLNSTEMSSQGDNRINIYGQSAVDNSWTPYNDNN